MQIDHMLAAGAHRAIDISVNLRGAAASQRSIWSATVIGAVTGLGK